MTLPDILTSSLTYYHNLIGVANLFLDVLYNDVFIPFEYDIPVINQQGEIAGRLRVKLQRINTDTYFNSENDSSGVNEDNMSIHSDSTTGNQSTKRNEIKFQFSIVKAYDLPINLNNLVFCQYQFWSQKDPVIVSSLDTESPNKKKMVRFDHEAEFTIETNEDFLEYCLDGALSIEVLCHRSNQSNQSHQSSKSTSNKNQKDQIEHINELNQMAKYQSLIDAWSEVSKSYELGVKILELNSEGNWRPVELKQSNLTKTGGIYQLKQGQSRQISVSLNQTKPNSTMWYNGMLFNLEPHKIDKISIGCIQGIDAGLAPLDSYQEVDLNKLKEKCRSVLENRKLYLYSQLKHLSETNRTEDEKDRYESLCKQLVDLGEEQAAIDAPNDNSHLPGSTIEWTPNEGMEEHVPIVYLDLSDEILNEKSNQYSDSDRDSEDTEADLDDRYSKYKNKKVLLTCGQDCNLKHEQQESSYINLKLISWKDSSRVEMVDSEEFKQDCADTEINSELDSDNKHVGLSLRAVARWDSSEHRSIYLNKETPLDKLVYLNVKINLKLKIVSQNRSQSLMNDAKSSQYIDLILRKRICVCVYSSTNTIGASKLVSFNRLKSMLGSSTSLSRSKSSNKKQQNTSPNSTFNSGLTSVTYRLISNIPKLLTEIENRESLASKAASCITEELFNNFEDTNTSKKN